MPEVLHESTGLKIVKNEKNRFCICSLHYTADPVKRTSAWIKEAKAGMSPSRWAKEYEMDYAALYGQRVFPEIAQNRSKIVVEGPFKEFGPLQTFWGGFDFGSRNPTSFHVYTIDEGVLHAVWELYKPCSNIADLATEMRSCPYYSQIKYIACDPTIIYQKSRTNKYGALVTLADLLAEYGIKKMIAGHVDETTWLATMRNHWKNPDDPTFRIWACCPAMITEFENAVYAGQSDREALTSTYKEQIEDVNNHALDDCKYLMNSRPNAVARRGHDPQMWKRWTK